MLYNGGKVRQNGGHQTLGLDEPTSIKNAPNVSSTLFPPSHGSRTTVNLSCQVSGLILQGNIPAGSEFEKFIPLFNAGSKWYTCLTGLVFTILAILMLLPDTFQAMVRMPISQVVYVSFMPHAFVRQC